MGKAVRAIAGVGAVGIIAALFLGRGGGFGIGGGNGLLPGSGAGETGASETVHTEAVTTELSADGPDHEEIPDTIIVRIAEKAVAINENMVVDEDALRSYIEEYNSDTRKFVLEDEDSILETYEWVTNTFKEMGVVLIGAE